MRRAYQYRAKINKQTEANCNQWLYLCRTIYNLALEHRMSIYRQHGKSISGYDQINQLPELKSAYPEFKFVDAQCLESVRIHRCSFCGLTLDRDLNASINILRFGQNRQASTSAKAFVA